MTYKRYAIQILSFLVVFAALNLVIWKSCTEVLLTKKYDGGDLARMSYFLGAKQFRKMVNDLPERHIEMSQYSGQKIDVMTIGDSFSNGGGEGRNSYYQDYIATLDGLTVLNVYPFPAGDKIPGQSPVSTLSVLLNSGYIDIIKPRYILIQSVARYCIPRFAKPPDLSKTESLDAVRKYYSEVKADWNYLPKVGFINEGNFKYFYKKLLYQFSDNAYARKVYIRKLSQDMFTAKVKNRLLFYNEDLTFIPFVTPNSVARLNTTLNQIASILAKKGIKLYFMPVVDKYDLYREFIINNPYPKNPFFAELRKLPRNYTLIDTKAILLDELRKGEKDVFFADDTHWTWKASKKVIETIKFQ